MKTDIGPVLGRLTALLVGAVVASSCSSDKIVYRSEPSFTTPPAAAANFVGYADTLTKQTVCGNCHVGQQAKWVTTKHANAWADLQASGHAGASCEPCHTISKNGNSATEDAVGYTATKDARYKDVQCESCHGPGQTHVTAPSLANRPLASIAVDTGTAFGNGCGECHTDIHNPFVDEWMKTADAGHAHVEAHALGNASCTYCHVGQDALTKWGVNTNYIEAGQSATNPMTVTCAVCHDPHGGPNTAQLRYPINVADTAGNLCMRCHQRNGKPVAPASNYAPMAPEGPVLLGIAGWFPPSYTGPDTIVGTHGSATNAKLCVTCHMGKLTVNDANGVLVENYQGHTFAAAPCLDAQGVPTTGNCELSQRSFDACATSGCHGSPAAARSAMMAVEGRLALLDSALNSQLVQIPATEFKKTTMNTAIGAKFNLQLAEKAGSAEHNPFLMETLLTTSITQVQKDYGIAPSFSVNLNLTLSKAPANNR
ncbi:MAG TPA: cytochrome c3 family protein [Gemmatimonadaceae bacterium]|nr:cytochrome c3 family protein [Gemmatimonadaceae bacterium]